MTAGTVVSRITGLLRLAAIAGALGVVESGRLTDTYNLANTAPNIIYELILGGVLTSVFIPVFIELQEKEGREKAWQVANGIMNTALVGLTALAIVLMLAAPLIANIYALRLEGAEEAQQQQVLTFLLRLFIPQIVFYALIAITTGLLNANRRFGPPMYTPILNNLAVIAVFIAFHQAYERVDGLGAVTSTQLWIIGLGTTAGVVINAVAQLPFLRGLGRFTPTFSLNHPSVRKLARLSVFVIGYVVANQIGYLVVQWLANAQRGGYSAYVWAFTFFMLPHGLFAVSIITALLPSMSQHAVNENWAELRERVSTGMRATLLLILPAAVGYFVLGEAIVRVLLEHGVMTARSTELVADVLRFFVLGLVPFSIFQLLLRAFYAIQDTKTPFVINCIAVVLNLVINVPMFSLFGVQGLAMGHAIAYVVATTLLGRALSRAIGGLELRRFVRSGARIAVAGTVMGGVVWVVSRALESTVDVATIVGQVFAVAVPVAVGTVVYLGVGRLVGVEELGYVRSLVTRRLGR